MPYPLLMDLYCSWSLTDLTSQRGGKKSVWGKPSPCTQTGWRWQLQSLHISSKKGSTTSISPEIFNKYILDHICNSEIGVKQSNEYFLLKVINKTLYSNESKTKVWFHINLSTSQGRFEHQSRRNCHRPSGKRQKAVLVLEGSALFLYLPFFHLHPLLRWLKIPPVSLTSTNTALRFHSLLLVEPVFRLFRKFSLK